MSDPTTDVNRLVEAGEVMEDPNRVHAALKQLIIIIERETADLAKLNKLESHLRQKHIQMTAGK